jgi:hypothetical protein
VQGMLAGWVAPPPAESSVDEESLRARERSGGAQSGALVDGFGHLGFLQAAETFVWGETKLACPRDGPKVGANILSSPGRPT